MLSAIYGRTLLTALEKAGAVPPDARRVIIDAAFDGTTKLYIERAADSRVFKINLDHEKGVHFISAQE